MNKSSIYPGEYTPLYNIEPLLNHLILRNKNKRGQSAVNIIDDDPNEYRLEIAMPGISRDQIILFSHEDILSIAVVSEDRKTRATEDAFKCFHHHISLPKNVDTVFAAANLRAGVLFICLPKRGSIEQSDAHQIIVY